MSNPFPWGSDRCRGALMHAGQHELMPYSLLGVNLFTQRHLKYSFHTVVGYYDGICRFPVKFSCISKVYTCL